MNKRLVTFAVLLAASVLLLATRPLQEASAGCDRVRGRLIDEHVEGSVSVGRLIGTITGEYAYSLGGGIGEPFPGVLFVTGTSQVTSTKGSLSFNEASAIDTGELVGPNGAVLMIVTGGTGKYEGATGHIVLSGFFHTDTSTGEWDYQGEVCLP